jgi:ribosomal protein S18 acetylase RimI-like enzyme
MAIAHPMKGSGFKHSMHPLDNVIWQALTTRQAHFAESFGQARRFLSDVTSLTALQEPDDEGYQSLATLVGPKGTAALFLDDPFSGLDGWSVVGGAPLLQMVCENGANNLPARRTDEIQISPLSAEHSRQMIELTTLTKPGPFGSRTHELGTYLGIWCDGKLVAMSGERLKVPGHTEVSAVCTHPDHLGKGYAATLMSEVMRGICERGEVPFLHVRGDNDRAIQLYERLGFRIRKRRHYVVIRNG